MVELKKHAMVTRDGYEVPLIGIPAEATLQECECCGEVIGLSKSVFTGSQILCRKCSEESVNKTP